MYFFPKPFLGLLLLLALGGVAFAAITSVRADRTFAAPYPDIHASADPAIVARGRYLVLGAAHCPDCHAAPSPRAQVEAGDDVPLAGGREFHLPFGVVRTKNITPDPETGIGRRTDPELARSLRYGVSADGHVVLPFMPFANLSDDDLRAVISYLRSRPPVKNAVKPHELNVLGAVVKAFVLVPKGPTEPLRATSNPGPTAEYGRYLANSVGNCVTCHTRLDATGELAASPFSGGAEHPSDTSDRVFVSPNLTPDPRWGWIADWTEEAFVRRMHSGPAHEGTPMPWRSFARLTDDDARALYRYFRTLPPSRGGPDPRDRAPFLTER